LIRSTLSFRPIDSPASQDRSTSFAVPISAATAFLVIPWRDRIASTLRINARYSISLLISNMVTEPTSALHMRFFELTSSNGNTAHVPVDQFLRIETFDDYQAGNGVVQVLFRNAGEENPYIVTINTTRGTQTSVASRVQGELSEGSNDPILIKPNMMPNVTGIIF
jgi:hypothetical protein